GSQPITCEDPERYLLATSFEGMLEKASPLKSNHILSGSGRLWDSYAKVRPRRRPADRGHPENHGRDDAGTPGEAAEPHGWKKTLQPNIPTPQRKAWERTWLGGRPARALPNRRCGERPNRCGSTHSPRWRPGL